MTNELNFKENLSLKLLLQMTNTKAQTHETNGTQVSCIWSGRGMSLRRKRCIKHCFLAIGAPLCLMAVALKGLNWIIFFTMYIC